MGPGFETNLLVVLLVLGILAGLSWILRPQLKRAYRYFAAWAEKDRREEEEKRQEAAIRAKAEEEVRHYFHPEETKKTEKTEDTQEDQQVQKQNR